MKELATKRLILREFKEMDYDDLYEYLLQLRDDEFEGYLANIVQYSDKNLTPKDEAKIMLDYYNSKNFDVNYQSED